MFVDNYKDIQDQILKFSIHDPLQNVGKYVSKIEKYLPEDLCSIFGNKINIITNRLKLIV